MLKAIVVSLKIPYCVHYILANWAFNTNGIHAAGEGGVKQEYQGCLLRYIVGSKGQALNQAILFRMKSTPILGSMTCSDAFSHKLHLPGLVSNV